ncbi:DinB family protein [Runella sp. CRIBMP]|uniref:DinB family protein n=1 Tax=Runella sp. CRIBMP TaxID=2683261 RepID=UPI001412F25C|nr:DinB family protein [Runella sp. CRIBMP]NBB19406.1 DinB family protein [Runella sp. CRIBMP]
MKKLFLILILFSEICPIWAQETAPQKSWTEADRRALVNQYKRTKAEINQETSTLTSAQWNFKEGPDKWTIGQVLEHLNMWSLLTQFDGRSATYFGERPDLAAVCKSDSVNTSFIYETNPHTSPDFTIPTGLIKDENNLKIFNGKYDEIIGAIEKSKLNYRMIVREGKDGNHRDLAQIYIIHYGHVDRHLRQIRRIKTHPNYPK